MAKFIFFKVMPEQEAVGGDGERKRHNRSAAEHSLNDLRSSSLSVFVRISQRPPA